MESDFLWILVTAFASFVIPVFINRLIGHRPRYYGTGEKLFFMLMTVLCFGFAGWSFWEIMGIMG